MRFRGTLTWLIVPLLGLVLAIEILSPSKIVVRYPAEAESGQNELVVTATVDDGVYIVNPFATATETPTVVSTLISTETTEIKTEIPTPVSDEELVIEKIGLASVTTPRRIVNGKMEDPAAPLEVSSYDLSAYPELKNQKLFAGHFDFSGFGAAIFNRLGELKPGDEIKLSEPSGENRYVVMTNEVYPISFLIDQLLKRSTWLDTLNLITCAGGFDPLVQTYTERRFIQAVRVE